jgi:hypothetical protein
MEYYGMVINRGQLASYLYKVLNSSCAKLLASKYSLSSQKKVEKKYGSLQLLLTARSASNNNYPSLNKASAINTLSKVNKKINTRLYLVEIKRFSSSKANSRNELTLFDGGLEK